MSATCLAVLLAGCASKPDPLIGDPSQADYFTAGASKAAPPPAPAPVTAPTGKTTAAPAPVASSPASQTGNISASEGVQTIGGNKTWLQRQLYRFTPFRINIQQGNFISSEQIAQLKEGMTREQVRFILGTPLVADAFHADRWDYPFRLQKGNGEVTASRVTVFFKDEKVLRFNGKDLPTEQDYINQLAGPVRKAKSTPTPSPAPSPTPSPTPSK